MRHYLRLTFALSFFIAFTNSYGQSDTLKADFYSMSLEELMNIPVSVATKTERNADEAPGTIRVITNQQIKDMNARTLRDVLNVYMPGMDVVPTYFKYGDRVSEGMYSRGILSDFSQQILVLYNGKNKFNETTFGSPYQAVEFTLENIERVEISSSPIPLQGGSAITIINIVTKEKSFEGVEVHANIGFNNNVADGGLQNKKFTAIIGKKINEWHVGSSVQFYDDLGQRHLNTFGNGGYTGKSETLRDGTKGAGNFTINVTSPNEKIELSSWYKFTNQDAFLSGLVPSQSNNLYNYFGQVLQNYVKIKPSQNIEITAGATTSRFDNFIDYAGFPYGTSVKNFDVYLEGIYTKNITLLGDHSILAGARIEREGQRGGATFNWDGVSLFNDTTAGPLLLAPNLKRNIYSAFVEDNWTISEHLSATLGLRYDHYRNFTNTKANPVNPRMSLMYTNKNLIVKVLYATAFRPPSIYELAGTALFPLFGDKNVTNEKMQTIEANLIVKTNKLKIQLSPYHQVYSNKITYVRRDLNLSDGTDTLVASNQGKTKVVGADITANYYFNKGSYLFVSASKFESLDELTNEKTLFLPDVYLSGGVNIVIQNFNLNLTTFYRGKRQLASGDFINKEKASGSHFNCNLSLSYQIKDAIKFYVLTENVTNAKNYVPLSTDGFFVPLRRRTYNIGTVVKF